MYPTAIGDSTIVQTNLLVKRNQFVSSDQEQEFIKPEKDLRLQQGCGGHAARGVKTVCVNVD